MQSTRPRALLLRALALSAVTLLLSACDECATTSLCGEPRIDMYGHLVWWATTAPAVDTEVQFVRTAGPHLREEVISVRPDSAGVFRLEVGAFAEGVVHGQLRFLIDPPNQHWNWAAPVAIHTTRAIDAPRYAGFWGVGPFE